MTPSLPGEGVARDSEAGGGPKLPYPSRTSGSGSRRTIHKDRSSSRFELRPPLYGLHHLSRVQDD